jgi:hypothetical protein
VQNRFIAKTIMKAKKKNEPAFPSNEIESLVEIATRVVALNFALYPEMDYVTDEGNHDVKQKIVEQVESKLDVTTTARNIDHEFYWEKKCKDEAYMRNVKKEQHGNSYK